MTYGTAVANRLYNPPTYDPPQYTVNESDIATWYGNWSCMLAKQYTEPELIEKLGTVKKQAAHYSAAHLRAVQASHSMSAKSQRRAHAGNLSSGAGDEMIAIRGAIQIHRMGFREHVKLSICPTCGREEIVLTWETDGNTYQHCSRCEIRHNMREVYIQIADGRWFCGWVAYPYAKDWRMRAVLSRHKREVYPNEYSVKLRNDFNELKKRRHRPVFVFQGMQRNTMTENQFNEKYPIGSPVLYYPVAGEPDCFETATRSAAWTLGSGQVVVLIDGRTGGVSINHIVPADAGQVR